MTPRDWVLAGASYLFIGVGVSTWMLGGGDLARTVIGALPMAAGLVALREFVGR